MKKAKAIIGTKSIPTVKEKRGRTGISGMTIPTLDKGEKALI